MLSAFFLLPRAISNVSLSNPLHKSKIEDPEKRSTLLRKAIDRIWNSPDLKTILQIAAEEIATTLDLDSCSFLWYFEPTQRVQVVCESNGEGKVSASAAAKGRLPVGDYPLDRFGKAKSAIARGKMTSECGSVSQPSRLEAMMRPIANCPIARLSQPAIERNKPEAERTSVSNDESEAGMLDAIAHLLVPVKGEDAAIGFMACLSQQPRNWSSAEIEFVQFVVQQLEIAIRQAQLYDRLNKQAQRERAIDRIVTQTCQSFDLKTILSQAIAQLLETLEVDRCLIHLVEDPEESETSDDLHPDDSFWEIAKDVAFRREYLFEVCREPFAPSIDDFDTHGPITQWTIAHREEVAIPDVSEDPRIGSHNPEYSKAEIKSSLVVPVEANGKLHAILYINQCARVRHWSQHDRELARAVADRLAISIQQACLYAQTRASMERETLLRAIGEQIRQTLDIKTILQTSTREVRKLLGADRVAIYQYHKTGGGKVVVEESTEQICLQEAVKQQDCFYKECAEQARGSKAGKVRVIKDIYKANLDAEHLACWKQLKVRASLNVPISTGSEIWGLLIVHECHKPRLWKASEIQLLQELADRLAIGIHQAELYNSACKNAIAAQTKARELERALHELQQAQAHLIQSEKMSSLGQLVAGVAHEINNPVNFIYGNLSHVDRYTQDLLELLEAYQRYYPEPIPELEEIAEEIDLEFLKDDMYQVLNSMKIGSDRIREIVLSLRNFSRLDQAEMKLADIHEGIDSTLLILQNRLKAKPGNPGIEVIKEYGTLPKAECYPGQLNQVFMNILSNAIDAIETANSEESGVRSLENSPYSSPLTPPPSPTICIRTEWVKVAGKPDRIIIGISDNGPGIPDRLKSRLFDPFFTTKAVGKGTGLGLSISYQIVVEKHKGAIACFSEPGQGTEFRIEIPVRQLPQHVTVSEEQLVAMN